MKAWYEIRASAKSDEAEVLIYDEIGGWGINAGAFAKDLKGYKGKRLNLRIHSPGGSILEGTAIYNALKRHKGGVSVYVDGLAASMATVVALAGDKVHAAENSLWMIHNPWSVAVGDSEEMRKTADLMDKMKDGIVNIYAAKTKKDPDEIEKLMDEETWMTATEAKAFGFVDELTEPIEIAASVRTKEMLSRFAKTPAALTSQKTYMDNETIVEPNNATPETTPEPQAVAPAIVEEIQASLTDIKAKLAAAETRASKAEGELGRVTKLLEGLKGSLGIAAAVVTPEINLSKTPEDDAFVAKWKAESDSGKLMKMFDENRELATRLMAEKKISFK